MSAAGNHKACTTKNRTNRIFVGLGSNTRREENLKRAISDLRATFGELELSSVYETAAVVLTDNSQINQTKAANYYNLVAGFDSVLSAEAINQQLKVLEGECLPRQGKNCPLDIDLLLVGDLITHENGLDIPRKDIIHYAYVAVPLAEIAGDLQHPETGKTYQEHSRSATMADQFLLRVDLEF